MQLSHEASDVATTIVAEKLLVEQAILFIVIQLQSAPFFATEHTSQGFIDEPLRSDREILLQVIIERYTMVNVLKKLDVLLQVLQVQLLLRFVEQRPISLVCLQSPCLLFNCQDGVLSCFHTRVELHDLARVQVKVPFVRMLHVFELLAVFCQTLSMLDNQFVAVIDLAYEQIALFLISLLELAQLLHYVFCVRLQILENFDLNLVLFGDFIHAALHSLVFVVDLVLEYFPLGLQIGQLEVYLLENVQLAIRLENGLLEVLHFRVGFLLLLPQLVYAILIVDQTVNNRVYQLLDQMPRFRLDIEPEQLKRGVVRGQPFEITRDQPLVLQLFLSICDLCGLPTLAEGHAATRFALVGRLGTFSGVTAPLASIVATNGAALGPVATALGVQGTHFSRLLGGILV